LSNNNKGRIAELKPSQTARQLEVSNELRKLAESSFHDDALKYFKDFTAQQRIGSNIAEAPPTYIGREHVKLAALAASWQQAFRTYISHRRIIKGYEDDKSAVSSLNILADYLFLYLPWWKEIYPASLLSLPCAPKDFIRYAFIHRGKDEPLSQFPMTFPEILKLRRNSRETEYSALKQIQLFFRFVESNLSDDNVIAGPAFRNPIFGEFDLPRVTKRTKTSKVVFPKNSYGYLVHYGYALEAFGKYLLDRCLTGSFSSAKSRKFRSLRWIDTERCGYIPFVMFRGEIIPIRWVPNVYLWTTRRFKEGRSKNPEVFVPHLTTLRLLLTAIEIGLRLSGLRWLDIRTWDKENIGSPDISSSFFHPNDKYVYDFTAVRLIIE